MFGIDESAASPPLEGDGRDDLAALPEEALEDELTLLTGQISAALGRWHTLLGEFDRRRVWAARGCRSPHHYLSWKLGVDRASSIENLRVAEALQALPLVQSAFCAGTLSYSKVRRLTRIATPETEAELVEIATHTTASQMGRLASAFRGALAAMADPVEKHRNRHLNWYEDDDGSVVISGRLSPEDGAVVVKALDSFEKALRKSRPHPIRIERSAAGSIEVIPDRPAIAAIEKDAHEPAASVRADALLALAEAALASEKVGRVGGDRHLVVVHVDVETLKGESPTDGDHPGGICEIECGPSISPETARRLTCDASIHPLLMQQGRPIGIGRRSRSVPYWIRVPLHDRDGGCAFPGCGESRYIQIHHILHWVNLGKTELENLVELCWFHHRLMHEGGYSLTTLEDGRLEFRDPSGVLQGLPPPRASEPPPLSEALGELGVEVGVQTCTSNWRGERMDVGYIVGGLMRTPREDHPRPASSADPTG